MKIESVYIKEFRNLNNFRIEFSQLKTVYTTVLIGQNASGKSNFLEAIVLIFKQLDFSDKEIKKEHWFEYEIIYTIRKYRVKISRKFENGKEKNEYQIFTNSKDLLENDIWEDIKKFKENKDEYLPKYVFAYYSGLGNSNRLQEHFEEYKRKFAEDAMKIKDNQVPESPRLFYAELIHSQLSLLSFFIDNENFTREFLKEHLSIDNLQTVLLTIQEPDWSNATKKKKDPKFFGSQGVVKDLLYYLHDKAFAPFRDKIENKSGLWEKNGKKTLEVVYLYFKNFDEIRKFVYDKKWTSFDFFHILNTANVSKLITKEGIKIRVKKKYADRILFKDLSEGEQQLLTVLGLMRFTYTEEALFLLDEPDTHLNALWQWKYMQFIDEIVLRDKDKDKSSVQVIMSSHSPLTIGSLEKENIRRFVQTNGEIAAIEPSESPKGMGVAGVLTEIFEIPSTLDIPTQKDLNERRDLQSKEHFGELLNETQKQRLLELNLKLDNLGYRFVYPDPLYVEFEMTLAKRKREKGLGMPSTPEEVAKLNKLAEDLLKELFDNKNI